MRKVLVCIAVIGILILIGVFYTSLPRKINEVYTGYIFSDGNKQVKEVPVTLKGNLYRGIKRNYQK